MLSDTIKTSNLISILQSELCCVTASLPFHLYPHTAKGIQFAPHYRETVSVEKKEKKKNNSFEGLKGRNRVKST